MAGAVACSSSPKGVKDGCVKLRVAVSPELLAPLKAVSGSACGVTFAAQPPGKVADVLAGTLENPGLPAPDVWIPDSSLWIATARRTDEGAQLVPAKGTSLASSPIVWGVPAALAVKMASSPQKPAWRMLLPAKVSNTAAAGPALAIPDPGTSATGLSTLIATQQLSGTGKAGLQRYATALLAVRSLAVKDVGTALKSPKPTIGIMSEQAALASGGKIIVANPVEGTLSLDYPYLVTTGDEAKRKAAETLLGTVRKVDFGKAGFRTAAGRAPAGVSPLTGIDAKGPKRLAAPDPEKTAKIRKIWNRVQLGARLLEVLDVSPSMAQNVPGTTTARIAALTRQIREGFVLSPDFVSIGLWEFSTRLDGRRHYRELAPIRKLGAGSGASKHRDLLVRKIDAARPVQGSYTGLYDTILAAYREVKRAYQPDVYNTALIFTDGMNQNPYGGLSLARLLKTLKAEYDRTAPVSVVIGAYGPDIDEEPLRRIAAATNGQVYVSKDARQTQRIFQDLLVRMLCDGTDCPSNP
ncbi:hypothetical protein [Actinocorallia longicatena]